MTTWSFKIKYDPWILKLLAISRNAGMSSIQSCQGRVLMNACGRGQINYVAMKAGAYFDG